MTTQTHETLEQILEPISELMNATVETTNPNRIWDEMSEFHGGEGVFKIAFETFSSYEGNSQDFSVTNSSEFMGAVFEFGHEVVGKDEGSYDESLVHVNPPECACDNSIVRLYMNGINWQLRYPISASEGRIFY